MSDHKQSGELQLHSDMAHERREWRVQRVGWAVLGLLCVAAVAGLLGPGPLSKQHAGKVGSELYVEYQKFLRQRAPDTLKVFCRPAANADEFTVSLDRSFVEQVQIQRIQPEATDHAAAGDEYEFRFKKSGDDQQLVSFHFEPDAVGKLETTVKLDGKSSHRIKQFVWP